MNRHRSAPLPHESPMPRVARSRALCVCVRVPLRSRSLSPRSFVGAIVDNFRKIRAERTGSALLTTEQIQWVKVMKECQRVSSSDRP